MLKQIAFAALLSCALSAPASAAVTIQFGGPSATPLAISGTVDGIGYTLSAAQFTAAPADLNSFSQLGAALPLRVTGPGVGVDGGASSPQLDTNQPNRREAFVLETSKAVDISRLVLSFVDANDTLLFFGVEGDGDLVPLINSGTIRSGLDGAADVVNVNALNQGTSVLTFPEPFGFFDRYVLTTRVGGDVRFGGDFGQGYRLNSISIDVVPEARTWALLIAGFGMIGVAARRRTAQQA